MRWKLYYPEGTFSSLDGEWSEAPPRGVQALAVPHPVGHRQIQTNDFYLWRTDLDQPIAADLYGVLDWMLESGHMTPDQHVADFTPADLFSFGIKWGRSLSDTQYNFLHTQIVADADLIEWGAKAGRLPGER